MSRLAPALTGLRLAVRGLWFRRSTAVIVLALATVASAASVVAPLYARAAEESIVRSTLLETDPYSRGVHISHPQGDAAAPVDGSQLSPFAETAARSTLTSPAFGRPQVGWQTRGTIHPVAGAQQGSIVEARVVERENDVCPHVRLTAGRCPRAVGEGLVTVRTLKLIGAKVGDTVPVDLGELVADRSAIAAPTVAVRVVGSFDPVDVDTPYWAGQLYFDEFFPEARSTALGALIPPVGDSLFLGPGTAAQARITGYTLDVPVVPQRVRLDDTRTLVRQVARLNFGLNGYDLTITSQLRDAIDRAAHGRDLVRVASPLAVTQLVFLAWWTLYLVVGSATEERSLELGLAKLRGLAQGQTARFGLAEVVLLLVVAAPLGALLGYLAVLTAAARVFAPGTEVTFTPTVLLTMTIALSGGIVTAALAARRVFRRSVTDLLRRVPSRRRIRGAGLLEGFVVALAVAGVAQLVSDRGTRPSPVALLAPGMVAVVGGLVAGRVLVGLARSRSAQATARGQAARLVGWSGLARRPGTARIASVLAVATCLLIVGVEAWTVADRNRGERASAEVGAAVVLHLRSTDSQQLLTAVRRADPGGRYAMAVVEVAASNQDDTVVAVDSSRADRILRWGPPDAKPARSVRSLVAPPVTPSIVLRPGRLRVTATVTETHSPSPMQLDARIDRRGSSVPLPMGSLVTGKHTYTAVVPAACSAGCRFAALGITHDVRDLGTSTAQLTLDGIAAGPAGAEVPLPTSFDRPSAWRSSPPDLGGAEVTLDPGTSLGVTVSEPGGVSAEVVHGDSPDPLPAFAGSLAGRDPAEPGAVPTVTSSGLADVATRYRITGSGPLVPRAGRSAVLVDLGLALRQAVTAPAGDREVWLSRDDPAAERGLTNALLRDGIRVTSRDTAAEAQLVYAHDGAVLALRLLLVCGAAAVLVAIGAMLVAAYVGRRQRAYEVAALRVVGLRRATVRGMLLRENLGAVLVALLCGGAAALVASWFVLPSLPQFDNPSTTVEVRYTPDAGSGWATLAALALVLGAVGLVVAGLQLRAGRTDRLREGVR